MSSQADQNMSFTKLLCLDCLADQCPAAARIQPVIDRPLILDKPAWSCKGSSCKVGCGSPAAHFLAESSKCTPHVGAHVTRRLIGDLDASLQDRLWHNLGLRRSVDGLSREEASEVCVSSLSSNLQLALQVGDPALHEMHIVQEHPAALLGVLVQDCLCWPFLTLHATMHFSL